MHKGLVLVAFAGLLVAGYLFITYTSPVPITCISGEGCKTVQASIYSSFFGIPTPAYGILFYLTLGIFGALWNKDSSKTFNFNLIILTSSALAVSIFLTYLEAFVVRAWCSWCVVSAILSVLAFIMSYSVVSKNDTHI